MDLGRGDRSRQLDRRHPVPRDRPQTGTGDGYAAAGVAAEALERRHRRRPLWLNRRTEAAMSSAIRTVGLTKAYGAKLALDSLDLDVEEGSIFGFLGPNGAGKTTTLRLTTGLARPTAGSIQVLGHDVGGANNAVRA